MDAAALQPGPGPKQMAEVALSSACWKEMWVRRRGMGLGGGGGRPIPVFWLLSACLLLSSSTFDFNLNLFRRPVVSMSSTSPRETHEPTMLADCELFPARPSAVRPLSIRALKRYLNARLLRLFFPST